MHHHLAASGNFGQVVRRNYPVSAVTAKPADERETVTVGGPLCTPLDTLGRRVELPRCEVGDLVVVHQPGALPRPPGAGRGAALSAHGAPP